MQNLMLKILSNNDFQERCKRVTGEATCLICVQKEQFVWWFSIGDNLIYLLHSELAELGQYSLNQRQFYQWVGKVNTFGL
ncbi:hypothetical protein PV797_16520 [Clostridiaceae bacterium M8S5]|nr:hypothetical protein PV797_16520 [Clostridiaceae bacterium M8S5]